MIMVIKVCGVCVVDMLLLLWWP